MKRFFAPLAQGRTYGSALYLLLGLPLGIFYFVFLVTAISLGGGLLVIWVGVPILFATLLAWRWLGTFDRILTSALLDVDIVAAPSPYSRGMSWWERIKASITDSYTWRSFGWLLLRFPLGIAGFVFVVVLTSVSLSLLAAPIALLFGDQGLLGESTFNDLESWLIDIEAIEPNQDVDWARDVGRVVVWFLPVLGVIAAAVSAHLIAGAGKLLGLMGRALLGPSGDQQRAVLQERTTVLEERTQLAHELHDSVGHTLTMIVVQAGAGGHVFDRDPEFARSALDNIETSGRRALGELDRILGLLRDDADPERAPQPGLERLTGLVDEVNAAGGHVTLDVEGRTDEVPQEVSRSAYRIVQESLTNVLKHAAGSAAQVRLHRTAGALELEVLNVGEVAQPEPAGEGGGRGLTGIRERVAMLGGSVEAGPRPGGGFRVWARLPIENPVK